MVTSTLKSCYATLCCAALHWNVGIDYALDLSYLLYVFPDIVDAGTAAVWRTAANQTWTDWLQVPMSATI